MRKPFCLKVKGGGVHPTSRFGTKGLAFERHATGKVGLGRAFSQCSRCSMIKPLKLHVWTYET